MDKKRIAVFDFQAADCAGTADAVRQFYLEKGVETEIVEFTAAKPFTYDLKESLDSGMPYDMSFIGVDDMMGVETARNIRELDPTLPLFLVSEVGDYGMEGFRLHALDYLIKPVSVRRAGEAVRRIDMQCLAGPQDFNHDLSMAAYRQSADSLRFVYIEGGKKGGKATPENETRNHFRRSQSEKNIFTL